jgi:lipoprotein-anchoring transpeptidase ErfK/SrfK
MNTPRRILVSVDDQSLKVMAGGECIAWFPVSTSVKGTGFEPGSLRTPTGRFVICEKIGHGEPSGTIFKARVPVGRWMPGGDCSGDLVLTRILRLDGLDAENRNTMERFIYIHGTNDENRIGQPASHGCVRLRNDDMIALFEMVEENDIVEIHRCDDII